jgi:hypothetical protein
MLIFRNNCGRLWKSSLHAPDRIQTTELTGCYAASTREGFEDVPIYAKDTATECAVHDLLSESIRHPPKDRPDRDRLALRFERYKAVA